MCNQPYGEMGPNLHGSDSIVLLFLLIISIVKAVSALDYIADDGISEETAQNFLNQAYAAKALIQSAVRESTIYQQLLLSFIRVMKTYPGSSLFSNFTEQNEFWDPNGYLAFIAWVPEVQDTLRSTFEDIARTDYPDFMIYNISNISGIPTQTVIPPHATPYYDPILYASPFQDYIGYDIQYGDQGSMLGDVKASGRFLSTAPFNVFDWDNRSASQMAVWSYLPLFGTPGNSTYRLGSNYVGTLVSAVLFQPMFTSVLQQLDLKNTDVFLFWLNDTSADGSSAAQFVTCYASEPVEDSEFNCSIVLDVDPQSVVGDIVTDFSPSFDIEIANLTYRILVRARQGSMTRDIILYPFSTISDDTQICSKMSQCAVIQQTEIVNIGAWDFFNREITYKIIGDEIASCLPQGILCNITIMISASPILINVTRKLCQGCVAALCYMKYLDFLEQRTKIPENALIMPQAWEVLGSGLNGIVFKADYCGIPVAIKCFTSLGRQEGSLNSTTNTSQGLQADSVTFHLEDSVLHTTDSNERPIRRLSRYDFVNSFRSGRSFSVIGRVVRGTDFSIRKGAATEEANLSRAGLKPLMKCLSALSTVRHPCVIRTLGLVELRKSWQGLGVVMDFAEFGSLWDLLRNKMFPLKAEIALKILQGVTQGMRFLHEASPPILHGDLKSSNVLVDRSFTAKLSDFGLSAFQKGSAQGSVSVCTAPEILHEGSLKGRCTAEADVWSFGVLIYECLTRDSPYADEDPSDDDEPDVSRRHHAPVPTPPGCSVEVAAIMRDCFICDPHRRPPFAELDRRMDSLDEGAMTSPVFADQSLSLVGRRQPKRPRSTSSCQTLQEEILDRFPEDVSAALLRGDMPNPEYKPMVTIVSAEVVGLGALSLRLTEPKMNDLMERLFTTLDSIAVHLGAYSLEPAAGLRGSAAAYLCVTNLLNDQLLNHAAISAKFALAAVRAALETIVDPDNGTAGKLRLRIGISSGPCVAAVVTPRERPRYALFGDTVHLAARMEAGGLPGRIQCTGRTAQLISEQDPSIRMERRAGSVKMKGRDPIDTYWVMESGEQPPAAHEDQEQNTNNHEQSTNGQERGQEISSPVPLPVVADKELTPDSVNGSQ